MRLPAGLPASVDRQARELDKGRNRCIVRALERALATGTDWSAAFIAELTMAQRDGSGRRELEALRTVVASRRAPKKPPAL